MDRRAALTALGAGAAVLAGCSSSDAVCEFSPATVVVVSRVSGTTTVSVTVERDGEELFSGTETLSNYAEFDEGLSIGCAFPVDLTVTVDAGSAGRTTADVTFPVPGDTFAGRSNPDTELRVTIEPAGIAVEADFNR